MITKRQARLGQRTNSVGVIVSDALPFGRLWYTKPGDAIDYAKFRSRSHDAVIHVYEKDREKEIKSAFTLQRSVLVALLLAWAGASVAATDDSALVALPKPATAGSVSLEQALASRRSIREFAKAPLSPAEIGQLLWATQGVTDTVRGLRVAPSAGALYPLELYVAKEDGLFRYVPQRHALIRVQSGDSRPAIAKAAHGQAVVHEAPVLIVITAVVDRTKGKYGSRAERYVTLEAGHAAQGLLLEATALKLGATVVGAFDDNALRAVVAAGKAELPLYVVAVGRPRGP